MKQIVYVGSSVTHAPDEYRRFVRSFKEGLRMASPAMVIDWIEHDSPIELDDFFQRDLNNVRMSDVMIALVDHPSIGIGMEIQEALTHGKPLMCLYQKGSTVSRLLLSAGNSIGLPISCYATLDHAIELASDFIARNANEEKVPVHDQAAGL